MKSTHNLKKTLLLKLMRKKDDKQKILVSNVGNDAGIWNGGFWVQFLGAMMTRTKGMTKALYGLLSIRCPKPIMDNHLS